MSDIINGCFLKSTRNAHSILLFCPFHPKLPKICFKGTKLYIQIIFRPRTFPAVGVYGIFTDVDPTSSTLVSGGFVKNISLGHKIK